VIREDTERSQVVNQELRLLKKYKVIVFGKLGDCFVNILLVACVTRERGDVEGNDAWARDLMKEGKSGNLASGSGDGLLALLQERSNRLLGENLLTIATDRAVVDNPNADTTAITATAVADIMTYFFRRDRLKRVVVRVGRITKIGDVDAKRRGSGRGRGGAKGAMAERPSLSGEGGRWGKSGGVSRGKRRVRKSRRGRRVCSTWRLPGGSHE